MSDCLQGSASSPETTVKLPVPGPSAQLSWVAAPAAPAASAGTDPDWPGEAGGGAYWSWLGPTKRCKTAGSVCGWSSKSHQRRVDERSAALRCTMENLIPNTCW